MFSCGISIGYPIGLNKSYFPLCFLMFLCPRKLIPPSKIQRNHYSSCWCTYEFLFICFVFFFVLQYVYLKYTECKSRTNLKMPLISRRIRYYKSLRRKSSCYSTRHLGDSRECNKIKFIFLAIVTILAK